MAFFNKIFPGINFADEQNSKKENLAKTKNPNLTKKVPILITDGGKAAAGKAAPQKIQKTDPEKMEKDLARLVEVANTFADEYENRINKVLDSKNFNDEQLAVIEEEINPVFDALWNFVQRYDQGERSSEIFNGLRDCMRNAEAFLLELSQFQNEGKQIILEEEKKSSSEELFQVCRTMVVETFQLLDEEIGRLLPGEDELPEEAYFLDKLNELEYDNLSGQEEAEIAEMLSILKAEISKSWLVKKREFGKYELARKAQNEKRRISVKAEIENEQTIRDNVEEISAKKEDDGLMRLKNLAEQIRNRVHYIDKNDFARKAVSSKDKVYDFDLRRDLAYFLANNQFLTEVEAGVKIAKTAADFQKFETLILQAADNENIGYVVYGERTYIVDIVEIETQNGPRAATQQRQLKTGAEFPMELLKDFKKTAIVFAENLKKESQEEVTDIITQEEQTALIRIFTKRFLREVISEKENLLQAKIFQNKNEREKFVEFVCESIFKKV